MIFPDRLSGVERRKVPQRIKCEKRNTGPSVEAVVLVPRLQTSQDQIFRQWLKLGQIFELAQVLIWCVAREKWANSIKEFHSNVWMKNNCLEISVEHVKWRRSFKIYKQIGKASNLLVKIGTLSSATDRLAPLDWILDFFFLGLGGGGGGIPLERLDILNPNLVHLSGWKIAIKEKRMGKRRNSQQSLRWLTRENCNNRNSKALIYI